MPLATRLQATNFGSPHGVTEQSKSVLGLWHVTYYIAIPLGLLVFALIGWCIFRYRHRPGSDRKPSQFQYHLPLEVAYTLIPLVLVAVVFAFMYGADNKVNKVSKNPALIVKVEGFQWGWRFTYPNGHQDIGTYAGEQDINSTRALPVLHLPEHVTVQLDLKADDVNHSFYVPEFLFKRDLIPGINNTVNFNINNVGKWIGECTQLCGTYHSYMRFMVDAMPVADFNTWMASQPPGSITQAGGA
ncbi:MAG: cytochrome c oxidase subunit II [Actinomycetota bacterium]|nr:cytochrome c oxidase subunit II [Actinomycetota bacterium]